MKILHDQTWLGRVEQPRLGVSGTRELIALLCPASSSRYIVRSEVKSRPSSGSVAYTCAGEGLTNYACRAAAASPARARPQTAPWAAAAWASRPTLGTLRATEVPAIHSLEHVPQPKLVETLREWRRVLAPAGTVRVHVPNAPEIFQAFLDSPVEGKWAMMGSILGMYCGPGADRPEDLAVRSEHQLIFDFPFLSWALTEAGFDDVEDLSDTAEDRHIVSWRDLVSHYSVVVVASR